MSASLSTAKPAGRAFTLGPWLGGLLVVGLAVLPLILSAVRGQGVNEGDPKFWQSVLILVFIQAIFAMSYNLLMGFTGILSFGHAMFFGSGSYAAGMHARPLELIEPGEYTVTLKASGVTKTKTVTVKLGEPAAKGDEEDEEEPAVAPAPRVVQR